jgi:type VI secretion system protein ImpL
LQDLARAYEFPRDLRKIRAGIVAFLAEVTRPSQIGVNPFLRGFYFAGMRAHLVEDVFEIGATRPQASAAFDAGATSIFSLAAAESQQAAQIPRRGGTRKVPQWVFLPHLFSNIFVADKSALETSRASTRTSFLKRTLLATTNVVILIVLTLITISFFGNRSLEERVAKATGVPVASVPSGTFAAVGDLESLDKLRAVLAELDGHRKDGPPVIDRFGLYKGDALYPVACQAYANRFRTLLLAPTQENILGKLRAVQLPPAAGAKYEATYAPLKTYLITASYPDPDTAQDTIAFLPHALMAEWSGNGTPDPDVSQLAQTQFQFYTSLLPDSLLCMSKAGGTLDDTAVSQARMFLNGFQGFQHVYQSMLADANREVLGFNYNGKFRDSSLYIVNNFPIPGAFTRDGFKFMQDAIHHSDRYLGGESWVLHRSSTSLSDSDALDAPDRTTLNAQLKSAYIAEYTQTWRDYLAKAQFIPFRSFKDAGDKLGALDSDTSPLLELFSLVSFNTAIDSPEISSAFQAPQRVVTPSNPDKRLIGDSNRTYIQSLQTLEGAVKSLTIDPTKTNDPTAAQSVIQTAMSAHAEAGKIQSDFNPDRDGNMDKISFKLLEDPIKSVENLAAQAPPILFLWRRV